MSYVHVKDINEFLIVICYFGWWEKLNYFVKNKNVSIRFTLDLIQWLSK